MKQQLPAALRIGDDYFFLCNPHTGSRACIEGFRQAGVFVPEIHRHHALPEQIPDDVPKISVLRNTVDWFLAFYWDYSKIMTLEEFIERPIPNMNWVDDRLDCYFEYVDYYFIYEEGLEVMFKELGYDVKLPRLGAHDNEKKEFKITNKQTDTILQKFAWDNWLYNEVLNGYRRFE